jgi:iron complex outermembrane receptor protein
LRATFVVYSIPACRFVVPPHPSLLFLAVSLALASTAAAAPQATTLDAVQVTAAADASAQAREALKRVPGASNVIDVAKADSRLSTSADVLAYQPGISAQSPGNEGTKISIRGSGINRGRARTPRALRCRSTACH